MWEECAIDPASGQPLCGSFTDYGMPRSDNLPSFATEIVEVLSPTNPFAIKAGGEGGCTPALAVVVSAILDVLAPLGVRDIMMLQGLAGDPRHERLLSAVGECAPPLARSETSRSLTTAEANDRPAANTGLAGRKGAARALHPRGLLRSFRTNWRYPG